MAFDISKNIAGPALPSKEVPDLRLPQRHTPDFRSGKSSDKVRSFHDELQAVSRQEPAKVAEPTKKAVSQAAESAKDKFDAALRSDASKASGARQETASNVASPGQDALSKLATEHRDDILSSPVAALLSSSSLQPQDLEALAQQNKFLKDLLLGDASLMLEQPIEAGELLDALGMGGTDSDLFASLKAELGEDLPNVTAASIFAAAGISPQQVLDRLNALRGQFVQSLDQSQLVSNDTVSEQLDLKNSELFVKDFTGSKNARSSQVGSFDDASDLSLQDELLGAQLVDSDAPTLSGVAGELANSGAFTGKENSVATELAGSQVGSDGISQPLSDFKEFKTWRDALGDAKDPASNLDLSQQAVPPLKGHKATFDAFHQMGERLDRMAPEQVTKIDMSQFTPTTESVAQNAPTPRFMDAVVSRFAGVQQAGLPGSDAKQMAAPSVLSGLPIQQNVDDAPGGDVTSLQRPLHLAKSVTAELQQAFAVNADQMSSALSGVPPRKFTVEELMADVTAGRMNLDFVKEDTSSFTGGDGGGDLSKFAKDGMSHVGATITEKPQAFGSEFAAMLGDTKEAAKSGMTPAERAEAAQKIMDSATYLMRQGTGSVRLDLSNSIHGPLEVAINMTDNNVDVRIFTESDPVREAMIADLSRLKEALQTQNVNLNHVEVGVGQQHAGSKGSDQNGQFAQQQDWRETFAQNMVSKARPASSSEAKGDIPAALAARRLNHMTSRIGPDGRLQVRI